MANEQDTPPNGMHQVKVFLAKLTPLGAVPIHVTLNFTNSDDVFTKANRVVDSFMATEEYTGHDGFGSLWQHNKLPEPEEPGYNPNDETDRAAYEAHGDWRDNAPPAPQPVRPAFGGSRPPQPAQQGAAKSVSPQNAGKQATEGQIKALYGKSKGLGWDRETLEEWLGHRSPEELNRVDASNAIDALNQMGG